VIVVAAFSVTPYVAGDGLEYLFMTEALKNHASTDIRCEDIMSAQKCHELSFVDFKFTSVEEFSRRLPWGHETSKDGKVYCRHFSMYALSIMPMRLILDALHLPALMSFQVTNSLFYVAAMAIVLTLLRTDEKNRFHLLLLLIFNPALFYVTWTHPEIFSFFLVVVSLVLFHNRHHRLSILFLSVSSMQNPAVIAFGVVIGIDYLVDMGMALRAKTRPFRVREIWKILLTVSCSAPFFVPIAHTYWNFGVPNLVAAMSTSREHLVQRALAYLFDLNLGMFPYVPVLVCLFIALATAGLFRHTYRTLLYTFGIAGIMAIFLHQTQINCGMAGIMRYNVWTIPFLVFFVVMERPWIIRYGLSESVETDSPPMLDRSRGASHKTLVRIINASMIVSSLITCLVILWCGGLTCSSFSYLEFSPMARFVLNRYPSFYNPYPGIFISRATHLEHYSTEEPVIYENGGYVRKALVSSKNVDRLLAGLKGNVAEARRQAAENRTEQESYYLSFDEEDVSMKTSPLELDARTR